MPMAVTRALLGAFLVGQLIAGTPLRAAEGAKPGPRLLERLEHADTVRIVALGDSLADGWELDQPLLDTYHRVFAQALRERFPAPVEVISAGIPGDMSSGGLERLPDDVLNREPDLVLVQFGGNDQRLERTPEEYGTDLETILQLVRERTPAAAILCTPPMGDTPREREFVERARRAGQRAGVPVADFERAIREGVHDWRHPFPYGSHPRAFTHTIMARELYRAFDELVGVKPALRVRLVGGRWPAAADQPLPVRAEVANLSPERQQGTVRISSQLWNQSADFAVEPGATKTIEFPLKLPAPGSPQRSESHRVWCVAKCPTYAAFDLKRLAIAPVVSCSPENGQAQRLGPDQLVKGSWYNARPDDLAAAFTVREEKEQVVFTVDVTDDDFRPGQLSSPSEGDSVELFLDLRPEADQGQPVYGPEAAVLIVLADAKEGRTPRWRTLDPPLLGLEEAEITCVPREGGYRVRVALPQAFIERYRGPDWKLFGFDVGVNDADKGFGRQSQLMWAGTAENYLLPGLFGAVVRGKVSKDSVCVTLR